MFLLAISQVVVFVWAESAFFNEIVSSLQLQVSLTKRLRRPNLSSFAAMFAIVAKRVFVFPSFALLAIEMAVETLDNAVWPENSFAFLASH
jgi:hypothetical protein